MAAAAVMDNWSVIYWLKVFFFEGYNSSAQQMHTGK
jgi:hypothetical protein